MKHKKGAINMNDIIIKTADDLYNKIMKEYCANEVELSDEYFKGVFIDMTKAALMMAYSRIQWSCNGDTVVRLDKNMQILDNDNLIPDEWNYTYVAGDAGQILNDINKEKKQGGYIFARICGDDEKTLLDLLFGEFEEPKTICDHYQTYEIIYDTDECPNIRETVRVKSWHELIDLKKRYIENGCYNFDAAQIGDD